MDDLQQEPQELELDSASGEEAIESTDNAEDSEQKVEFDERQQAKVNELIGEKVAKQRSAEREAQELQARLDKIEADKPKVEIPDVPELPADDDFYADPDKFRAQIADREKLLAERAEALAEQKAQEIVADREAQRQQLVQQQEAVKRAQTYFQRSTKAGIDEQKAQQEANIVSQYLTPEIGDYLVDDPDGPLIVNHLAQNIVELDKMQAMTPVQAAAYIATEVKPKLSTAQRSTKAPAPATIVDGGGSPKRETWREIGATLE